MNDIYFWGILASITGIAIMFSVIKHKKSVSAVKYGTYLIFSILMICLGITTILFKRYDSICCNILWYYIPKYHIQRQA